MKIKSKFPNEDNAYVIRTKKNNGIEKDKKFISFQEDEEDTFKNMVNENESESNSRLIDVGKKKPFDNIYNIDYTRDFEINEYNIVKYLLMISLLFGFSAILFLYLYFYFDVDNVIFSFLITIMAIDLSILILYSYILISVKYNENYYVKIPLCLFYIIDCLILLNFILKLINVVYLIILYEVNIIIWYSVKLLLDFYFFIITTKIFYLCKWFSYVQYIINYIYINILIWVGMENTIENEVTEGSNTDLEYSTLEEKKSEEE